MAISEIFNLNGKVAIVTGGYKGIGSVFSRVLSEAGAIVVIAARNENACKKLAKDLEEKNDTKAVGAYLDVGKKGSVKELVSYVEKEYGRIDILVNAAGISGVEKPTVELTEEEFDQTFNVDFKGTLFCSQEVAKVMMKQKSGRIINVSSVGGKFAIPYLAAYSVSKAGVLQLTKAMALELGRYNIQVNALCPGYFLTDMNKDFFESERGKQYIKERIPLRRVGKLEELESTVLYLATAPPFLTGTEITIDGAQSII